MPTRAFLVIALVLTACTSGSSEPPFSFVTDTNEKPIAESLVFLKVLPDSKQVELILPGLSDYQTGLLEYKNSANTLPLPDIATFLEPAKREPIIITKRSCIQGDDTIAKVTLKDCPVKLDKEEATLSSGTISLVGTVTSFHFELTYDKTVDGERAHLQVFQSGILDYTRERLDGAIHSLATAKYRGETNYQQMNSRFSNIGLVDGCPVAGESKSTVVKKEEKLEETTQSVTARYGPACGKVEVL